MLGCARVFVMEYHYLQPSVDLSVYLQAIVTHIIVFPLDEVFKGGYISGGYQGSP
jgi:hypothetical protein